MRQKLVQFFAGIILYSLFGILMIWLSGVGFEGQWTFLSIWIIGMALVHTFIIEPMRVRMAKKRTAEDKR